MHKTISEVFEMVMCMTIATEYGFSSGKSRLWEMDERFLKTACA